MRTAWLLVCAGLLLAACGRGDHRAGWDWERMRVQPRYDAYGPSRFFADSSAMQAPPAGTVARERIVDQPLIADGEAHGQLATRIPIPVTSALLARGRSRFDIYCAVCHGAGGFGGSGVAMNMQPPRPPSLRSAAVLAMPPGFLYGVIRNGFGRMPSYAADLTPVERWAVVAYVERLQQLHAATPAERADSVRAAHLAVRPAAPAPAGGAAPPPASRTDTASKAVTPDTGAAPR
ncbi:MAG TPA: cytochrome c [Gemmatimonadaceae bacterium]|nr:cytochrome c [Gemmatimonadaceae bacterium]